MRNRIRALSVCLVFVIASPAWSQSTGNQTPASEPEKVSKKKAKRGPAGDVGSGAANIGTGAASGAGSAATGAAKGAADLGTLHPIGAASAVGSGAAKAGTSVAVGTAKGTAKIGKGVGRAFKKLF
jgi:hypothetical protein